MFFLEPGNMAFTESAHVKSRVEIELMHVRGKLKLFIKCKIRPDRIEVSKRIDVSKLKDSSVCENLQETIVEEKFAGTLDQFKTEVFKVRVEILDFREKNGIGLIKMNNNFRE